MSSTRAWAPRVLGGMGCRTRSRTRLERVFELARMQASLGLESHTDGLGDLHVSQSGVHPVRRGVLHVRMQVAGGLA